MQKSGMVSWDDLDFNKKEKFKTEDKPKRFITLAKGKQENNLRIIAGPYQYTVHDGWKPDVEKYSTIDEAKVQKWGYSIKCAAVGGNNCPLCESGHKPRLKWYLGVIQRVEGGPNQTKILDVKKGIIQQIKKLQDDKRWGNPMKYDICIKIDEKADPKDYYTVTPVPPEPLDADDLRLKDDFDLEELQKLSNPLTSQEVNDSVERIVKYLSNSQVPQSKSSSSGEKVVSAAPKPAMQEEVNDSEFTFQDT